MPQHHCGHQRWNSQERSLHCHSHQLQIDCRSLAVHTADCHLLHPCRALPVSTSFLDHPQELALQQRTAKARIVTLRQVQPEAIRIFTPLNNLLTLLSLSSNNGPYLDHLTRHAVHRINQHLRLQHSLRSPMQKCQILPQYRVVFRSSVRCQPISHQLYHHRAISCLPSLILNFSIITITQRQVHQTTLQAATDINVRLARKHFHDRVRSRFTSTRTLARNHSSASTMDAANFSVSEAT